MTNTLKLSLWKRCSVFSTQVSERATVQVPTGLHSQTVVTGWSNYWAADTPAWLGFIFSRKRDSQITVYPHWAPSLGLILQLQMEKPHTNTLTPSHAYTHPDAQKKTIELQLPTTTENGVFLLFIPHVCCACASVSLHALTQPLFPVKHTYSNHQSK